MRRVAMGDVWDEARAFVTREAALLLPLSFATLGASYLLLGYALPVKLDAASLRGAWTLALVPSLGLTMLGNLALSALVLVPHASVGEAARGAFARLGRAVLATLLAGAGLVAAWVALALVAALLAAVGAAAAGQQIVAAVLLAVTVWLTVRILPLFAVIAVGNPRGSPLAALRETLALTRGRATPIAAMLLLYLLAFTLVSFAIGLAVGSLLVLFGRMIGDVVLGETLLSVVAAVVASVMQGGWTVFIAVLTRRLMAARDG